MMNQAKKQVSHAATFILVIGISIGIGISSLSHAGDNIIRPYQGIRSSGMGGTLISTGLYDENFFGNPARTSANPVWRLTAFQVQTEANYNAVDIGRSMTKSGDKVATAADHVGDIAHLRGQIVAPAIYVPHLGTMSYAFGILASVQTDVGAHRYYSFDPTAIVDVGPALSVSKTFMDEHRLAIGTTLHLQARANTKSNYSLVDWLQGKNPSLNTIGQSGAQYDFDIGSTYRVNWMPLGFTVTPAFCVNNVLDPFFNNLKLKPGAESFSHPARRQPRTFNTGASFTRSELWIFTDSTFAFEIRDFKNNRNGSYFRLIHMGAEIKYGMLSPRLGINQGYFAAGLGIDLPVLKFDFATYGEEMSLNPGGIEDRRYAVQIGIHI